MLQYLIENVHFSPQYFETYKETESCKLYTGEEVTPVSVRREAAKYSKLSEELKEGVATVPQQGQNISKEKVAERLVKM